jgi:hypothetical protein
VEAAAAVFAAAAIITTTIKSSSFASIASTSTAKPLQLYFKA